MASRRTKLTIAASALVLGSAGYFLYSVFAVQGQGTLAQAPLNDQVVVPPAFIMALDDSGSMRFQTLFPARDGGALWGRDSSGQPYSFFHSSGTFVGKLRGTDPDTPGRQFVHVAPYPAPRQATPNNDNAAIPPIDAFGFSRSHVYNRAYFDPFTEYKPWRFANGDYWPDADPAATRVDPNSAGTTVNLTVERTSTSSNNATHHAFRIRNGMVLPEGTKVYGTPCDIDNGNSDPSTPSGWVVLDEDVTMWCDQNVYIGYFPAAFYLPEAMAAPPGFITANRVLAVNACTYRTATGADRCNMYRYEIRPSNYAGGAAGTAYQAAIKNFANWFSYYGARNRSMVAAVTHSLIDVQTMRVGYFTINNRTNAVMRDMGLLAEKDDLYDDIVTLGASGNTPNLPAVAHLGAQFRRTGDDAPIIRACQRNAGMLFTDGLSNVDGPNVGNVDGAMGEPFADGHSSTLADIATSFYLDAAGGTSPLRTDLAAGQVPRPEACTDGSVTVGSLEWKRLDCQTNLHMNFYGVTLGARGETFNADIERDPFVAPHPAWPDYESGERSTVDDIWHATVNTRGEFINATTPADITAAMRRVLAAFGAGASPSGSIALTGARIGAGSLTVEPFYEAKNNGTDWYSTLTAQTVSTNPITGVVTLTNEWEASAEFPNAASRAVWFGRGSAAPVAFNATNVANLDNLCNNPRPGMALCTAGEIAALGGAGTPITLSQAIDYLKGDQSLEVNGTVGKLRSRTTVLGDIVNSTPVISAPTDDYGYRSLPGTLGTSYSAYLVDKADDRRSMVYAGANDGMLHAFDGRLEADGGGVERFAFIPQSVLGHMGNLLFPYDPVDGGDQKFRHRYYVDGPVTVSDAYYGSDWETVLVGTTGAGARGAFALNVSDVSETSGSFDGSDRLWEISDLNMSLPLDVRENIGYVLGRPVIVPIRTGSGTGPVKWRAVFGNGYNSVSGKAVLFLVDIDSGTPNITMIEAEEAGAPAGNNGLGNLVVIDHWGPAVDNSLTARRRDGFADTVYAADQKGAIWKFDLRDADPADIATPLFTTLLYDSGPEEDTRQPILGGLTAAAGPGGGVMVYFGTGSFSFEGDPSDDTLQTLYAVLDNGSGTTVTRSDLLQQTVGTTTTDADGRMFRDTSENTGIAGRSGWYLDLPDGERFVGYPRIESGVVFMPTYMPNATATGCDAVGNNWLYGLNALTGAAGLSRVRFGSPSGDSPGSGTGAVALVGENNTTITAPVKDVAVMTSPRIPPLGAGATPAELAAALAAQCAMVVQVAGAPSLYMPRACGRQSWRQIQ